MDQKKWLWRKKSLEKTFVGSDEVKSSSIKVNEENVDYNKYLNLKFEDGNLLSGCFPLRQSDIRVTSDLVEDATSNQKPAKPTVLVGKAELEKDFKTLNDKLSSAVSECKTKDEHVKNHAKMAQEAISGLEKAESEAVSLKIELDEATRQRLACEDRLAHLDAALKECMHQLRFVREEQEKRIHDAVMKTSREFEKSQMVLEEKLVETGKGLAKMGVENSHLSKALVVKEKAIEDLNRQLAEVEADFNALISRLESTEKDKASLKYEVRVLEKEVEIRNEEREFNRRTADASHRQQLESVKKIAKLESESQGLRVLVQKRLPGPAALSKMKNEVGILGKDSFGMRNGQSNSAGIVFENSPGTPDKRIGVLNEMLFTLEEENRALKEALSKKPNEHYPVMVSAPSASKLSQNQLLLEESSKYQTIIEPSRTSLTAHEVMATMSDIGSDDKVSSYESSASALILELERLRNGKLKGVSSCKTGGSSDIDLMDDFLEMEKLAIISMDKLSRNSHISSSEVNLVPGPVETVSDGLETMAREATKYDGESDLSLLNHDLAGKDKLLGFPCWLQEMLKMVLEQSRATERNPEFILDDIRVALEFLNYQNPGKVVNAKESSNHPHVADYPCVGGNNLWKSSSKYLMTDSASEVTYVDITLTEKSNLQLKSDLSESLLKLVELIEGIDLPSPDYDNSGATRKEGDVFSETPTGYLVRVFQWKVSELSATLRHFTRICYDLLNGMADPCKFVQELTTALEWVMNHCFSIQDVSSMRESIKKQFDWDDSKSGSEVEVGMIAHLPESNKLHIPEENFPWLNMAATSNNNNIQTDVPQVKLAKENKKPKVELMNLDARRNLERMLRPATDTNESLIIEQQESEKTVVTLQEVLGTPKETKGVIVNQIDDHQLANKDFDIVPTSCRAVRNEACPKVFSVEVELGNKNEELQLQLKSTNKKHMPNNDLSQEEQQVRTDQEITSASEKLAGCQETILNLSKQLMALAAPREKALFDKVIAASVDTFSTTTTNTTASAPAPLNDKTIDRQSSLLGKMLAEDNAAKDLKPPKPTRVDSNFTSTGSEMIELSNGDNKNQNDDGEVGSLAILPSKKSESRSLWMKLFRRKKKVNH